MAEIEFCRQWGGGDQRSSRPWEKYEILETLGGGAFGEVKLAINKETNEKVALKFMKKNNLLRKNMFAQVEYEVKCMNHIRHPNVLRIYEVLSTSTTVCLVLEHAPNGDLFDKIVEEGSLHEDAARKYFQRLVHAVDYMHSKGVCHRDLKLENLLLDSNGDLKIADFGFGTVFLDELDGGLLETDCGNPFYSAPEVMKCEKYDGRKADTWSCGVVLYGCIAGVLPFSQTDSRKSLITKMSRADFSFTDEFSVAAIDLIRQILDPDPTTRITTTDIMKTNWFQQGYQPPFVDESPFSDKRTEIANLLSEQDKIEELNAFQIFEAFFNFNCLIESHIEPPARQTRFTCNLPAEELISKIKAEVKSLGMVEANWINLVKHVFIKVKLPFMLKLRKNKTNGKDQLAMVIKVYEIPSSDSYLMVEFTQSFGDTLEFHRAYNKIFNSVMRDISTVESISK